MTRTKDLVAGLAAMGAMVVLPAAARGQTQDPRHPESVAPDSILAGATVQLTVDGMSCPFCAYGLEKRLRSLPAVDSLAVRVGDGLVQIREKDGHRLTDEELRREVARAGFTLRDVRRITP